MTVALFLGACLFLALVAMAFYDGRWRSLIEPLGIAAGSIAAAFCMLYFLS